MNSMLDFIWTVFKDVFAPGQLGFYIIVLGLVGISIKLTATCLQKFNRHSAASRVLKLSGPIGYMIMGAFIVDLIREVAPIVVETFSKFH
ncbi:hypothetical protein [Dendrosporobacter sp. 1207_IL3150]|uniref:hypothetical protein n=1 Tax=Dendrosporobacter sp. 1207_IL3150 TaxID=3084054 RepID=UPI002FDAC9B2